MAERVFIALGQKPRFLMLPSNFLQTGFRAIFQRMNEDLVFDVAEGLKILDYQPRPFKLEFPDMLLDDKSRGQRARGSRAHLTGKPVFHREDLRGKNAITHIGDVPLR